MLAASAPNLALVLLLATALEANPQQCEAEGTCEADQDGSLLQTKRQRRAPAGSPLDRDLTADVWLTEVNGNAQAVGILKQGSPISFQASGAFIAARSASGAALPQLAPRALPHQASPTMTCKTINGAASRACQIVPPAPNSSFLLQKDRQWQDVDGGSNRACRGANKNDNADSYYKVISATKQKDCKTACEAAECCTGFEYQASSGRCELWTKQIQASASVGGFTCKRWQPMATCAVWDGTAKVTVDASKTKQTMRGFGAAMTQSSAFVLKLLKDKNQGLYDDVMKRLFGQGDGAAGISMVRFPMGSCDYARTESTYDDIPQPSCTTRGECPTWCSMPWFACDPILTSGQWKGQAGNCQGACGSNDCRYCSACSACCCAAADYSLSSFALDSETKVIVEILKDAKAINPGLLIMGSPWTPPRWLKNGATLDGKSKDNTLLTQDVAYDAYAQYFLKTKEAFQAEGVPIDYFTLQNEPLFAPDYPGMYLSASDYGRLGQKVKAAIGDYPKLLAYDHNWNEPGYPLSAISKAGAGVFNGTAFHCYGGSMTEAHATVLKSHPDLEVMMTECTGSYPNNQCDIGKGMDDFGYNHEWDMRNLFLNNVLNGGSAGVKWVMALDEWCGPTLPGVDFKWGRPLVSVPYSATQMSDLKFNQDFWTVAHMGRFVRPGAQLIETTVSAGGNNAIGAFKDTGAGTITLMAVNFDHRDDLTMEIDYNGQTLSYSVPAWGTAVLRWPLSG